MGTAGTMSSTSMEVSLAARLGGGGHKAMAAEVLGVARYRAALDIMMMIIVLLLLLLLFFMSHGIALAWKWLTHLFFDRDSRKSGSRSERLKEGNIR